MDDSKTSSADDAQQPGGQQPGAAEAAQPFSLRLLLSFGALLSGLNSVATIWIIVLMIVINIDVFGRTAFSAPLPGVPELVKLSIVGIIFLQLGHTLRVGRITRADTLMRPVRRHWPRVALLVRGLYSVAGVFLFGVLFEASAPLFWKSWVGGEYAGIEGYVSYPVWPVRLIILIGSACAALQYAVFVWQDFNVVFGRRPLDSSDDFTDNGDFSVENPR
jgi:TRAP-type mannitol/chloroaromatic compound transport system permease small subunit